MNDAVADVVRQARLTEDAGRRRTFTVAREEAVLALRARPAEPWAFTLPLLRAAVVLDREAVVTVDIGEDASGRVITFAFVVPSATWDEIDLAGLLSAALEPDRGHDPSRPVAVASAFRRLVGRSINGALGEDMRWVELRTPVGGRRWERITSASRGDPYAERLRSEPTPARTLELAVGQPEPSLVRRLWSSPRRVLADIARLWSLRLGHAVDDPSTSTRVLAEPGPSTIDLGGFATWTPDPAAAQLVLVRDGVALAPLIVPELADPRLRGRVECPALALDIDEKAVVADEDFDRLVAWLLETIAVPDAPEPAIDPHVVDGEVLWVWRHRARSVPAGLPVPVMAVWPGELARLRGRATAIDFVPFSAFHEAARAARADLTALEQGSLGAVDLDAPPLELDATTVRLRVSAWVHRYPAAEQGVVRVLAWRRELARVDDPARTLRGVTVLAEIEERHAALASDPKALDAIVEHARATAFSARARLLAVALERLGTGAACWSVPLVRHGLDALDGVALGLHYAHEAGTVRLTWDDTPVLGVQVGKERDGTPRTLADALVRARDVGGVVIGDDLKVWYTLESDDPELSAWVLDEHGRALLLRVLGSTSLWEMPIVPEAQPRPRPIAEQPQIVLGREEVAQKLAARTLDGHDAEHLLAHLLASHSRGEPTQELDHVPLLRRYDPRALTPRTRIGLAAVRSGPPLRVAPFGAVGRWLAEPVLEVSPAIAAMLHEALGLLAAPRPSADADREAAPATTTPIVVRRADPAAVLVRVPIADRLCAGALQLAEAPSEGIELWARGLRVGSFRLPSPLRDLGGRLWLTDAGIEAGHAGLVKVALQAGKLLVERAMGAVALSPPRSPRAAALQAFLDRVRRHVRAGPDFMGLGELVTPAEPPESTLEIAPLRRLPPPRDRLQALLRWALARPVQIETAWLSWRAATVLDAGVPGRLELGSRHPLVGKALRDDAVPSDLWPAAIVVVAATLAAAPDLARADVALARILATARASTP